MIRRLVRCIPHLDFVAGVPPRFLFASGRRNRCNPDGVRCLYFAEDERTAETEYRRYWRLLSAEHQPKLVFFARVTLRRVLDLGDSEVAHLLGISESDLFDPWRLTTGLTRLQELGLALSAQRSITAIRYPSAACRAAGIPGWNVALFADALRYPDRVEILGVSDQPLEILPGGL